MMRTLAIALSLAACGGGSSDPSCDGVATVELPQLGDTYVDGSGTAHGGEGSLLIGATNRGLLRFALGPELRAPNLRFVLTLTIPQKANECGGTCGPCPAMAPGTSVNVSLVRSDWDETLATSSLRTGIDAWSMPGPSGVDIVQLAASSATSGGSTVGLGFNALGLSFNAAWPADEISILVSPVATASAAVRYSSRSNDCEPATSAPRLVATCP